MLKSKRNASDQTLRVTAILPLSGHGHPILRGASDQLKRQGLRWSLRPVEPGKGYVEKELREWDPQLALIQAGHERAVEWCRANERPYVLLLGAESDGGKPKVSVGIDDRAVGRMAADYFRRRGHRHFGYVGNKDHPFSLLRHAGFEGVLKAHGFSMDALLHASPEQSAPSEQRVIYHQAIGKWLAKLPKPVAVFASNDVDALSVVQAATEAGLDVPADVSVMGAGDDPLICKLCAPDISSVKLPFYRLGVKAVELLMQSLRAKKDDGRAQSQIELPPVTTVTRGSSNFQRVEDPEVARAIAYFHRHIEKPVKIKHLLVELNSSRANLERRFKDELGHTPLVELRRLRIERACRLLADTNLNNAEIAERCGITSNIRFVTSFKQLMGTTPAQYRADFHTENLDSG